jgi:adenosine deaminase
MRDSDRAEILLEDMNGKFDAILEYVIDIPDIKSRLTNVESKLSGVESRLSEVEASLLEVKDEQRLMRFAITEDAGQLAQLVKLHPGMKHS